MNKVMNSWTFGGVRLSNFGHVTELDSYLDLPVKRNSNVVIPLVNGAAHAKKFFDQKTVSFGIEVTADAICDLETTFDTMKQLFGSKSQQYLEYISSTGPRRALAEVVGQLGVTRGSDPLVAKIVVDFLLAEPFFRSTVLHAPYATITTSPHNFDPLNIGTAEERASSITLYGPMEHPKIEHVASGVWVQYDLHLITYDYVTIDCKNYLAYLSRAISNDPASGANIELNMADTSGFIVGNTVGVTSDAGAEAAIITVVHLNTHITVNYITIDHTTSLYAGVNVINYIKHGGDPTFMVLLPGINHLHVTDANPSTGQVKIEFYPPYL